MTQIIPICIGKAGIQSSALFWQLLGLEHQIDSDGILKNYDKWEPDKNKVCSFYHQSSSNKFKLNAMCLDMDTQAIDSLKTSSLKKLYQPTNLISNKSNSNGIFAKGWLSEGNEIVQIAMDPIRKIVEKSEKFGGFMLINSTSGGTGSGISSRILSQLSSQFSKNQKICINIFPQNDQLSAKTAYNTLFTSYNQLQFADVSLVFDNQTITTLCQTQLNIKNVKYNDLNQLIAYCLSGLTNGMRKDECLNVDFRQIITNTIPYPRVKFLLNSYAPLVQVSPEQNPFPKQLTIDLFDKKSALADCRFQDGKFLASSVTYRGDIIPKDVGPGIMAVKTNKTMQFVDWCPTGFKCGISYYKPRYFENSIVPRTTRTAYNLCHSTCIKHVFKKAIDNFTEFYEQKSMVNQYLQEGMDLDQFTQCLENLVSLCADYDEMELETAEEDAAMPSQQG